LTRYFKCKKCGVKVVSTYLAKHWLRRHFELMYVILETESQSVFSMDGETGKVTFVNMKELPKSYPAESEFDYNGVESLN